MSATNETPGSPAPPPLPPKRRRGKLPYGLVTVLCCCLGGVVLLLLLIGAVPRFAAVFESMDVALPTVTRVVIAASQAVRAQSVVAIGLAAVVGVALVVLTVLFRHPINYVWAVALLALLVAAAVMVLVGMYAPMTSIVDSMQQ